MQAFNLQSSIDESVRMTCEYVANGSLFTFFFTFHIDLDLNVDYCRRILHILVKTTLLETRIATEILKFGGTCGCREFGDVFLSILATQKENGQTSSKRVWFCQSFLLSLFLFPGVQFAPLIFLHILQL